MNGTEKVDPEKRERVLLCNTGYDPEKEKAAVKMLVSMNADAIIIASCSEYVREIINKCPIPVVALDTMLYGANVEACVFCDYYEGGRMAMEHLIENGCKKIVCIKGPQYRYSARARYQGYLDVCRERDIPERTVECDYDFNQGIAMTEKLLKEFRHLQQFYDFYPDARFLRGCDSFWL